nr:hypothetical protein Iba_chr12dCG8830 [Ipomoea batatas]
MNAEGEMTGTEMRELAIAAAGWSSLNDVNLGRDERECDARENIVRRFLAAACCCFALLKTEAGARSEKEKGGSSWFTVVLLLIYPRDVTREERCERDDREKWIDKDEEV